MSVIPLSVAIKDGLTSDTSGESVQPIERPGSFDTGKFDKQFESAWEQHPKEQTAPQPRKSLDQLLSENIDKAEAAQEDEVSFEAARDARRELNERYGKQGDLSQTLNMFLGWVDNFRANPTMAGQGFAESYMRASPWALKEKKEKPPVDDPYKKLDRIIEDAIEHASSEKKDFAATAAQRAKLKEVFPNMTFDEALAKVVQIDREMHQNPLETAGKLAAAFNMPVTPRQVEQDRHVTALGAAIDRVLPTLPNFDMKATMSVIGHPEFKRTGDPVADLQRGHAVVGKVTEYMHNLGHAVQARMAQLPPELAREVENVISSPGFQKIVSQSSPFGMDGEKNLEMAIGVAMQRMTGRVNKAKRAVPVRSRSTHSSNANSDSRLDAIISRALGNL